MLIKRDTYHDIKLDGKTYVRFSENLWMEWIGESLEMVSMAREIELENQFQKEKTI